MRTRHRSGAGLVVAAMMMLVAPSPPARAQRPHKTVLIVHGGPEAFPGSAGFDAALRQTLFSHSTTEIDAHTEHLENEEFPETAEASLRESIRLKFHDHPIDLAIANTAPALQFLLANRDALFPKVPIIFTSAVPPAGLLEGTLAGVTGALRTAAQSETMDLMLKLHPGTKRVHVIAYAPGVPGYMERVPAGMAPYASRVVLTYETSPVLADVLANIKRLPADTLIFYGRYTPITEGRVQFPDALLTQIADASPVPIYSGGVDSNLGRGVVGGMMRNSVDEARRLGEIALRVLEGTAPERIPVEAAHIRPAFDWRQLQRWNIDESLLPEGSEIRFRVPTVWELYGNYIITTVIILMAQAALIAGLLRQRARLRNADNTIRASETSLRGSYERIRDMAGRLISAQEAARADIARDLHDDVCQKLAYVSIGVASLRESNSNIQDPETQKVFEELDRDTRSTFDGIRRLSHELHPATLRLLGLAPALRSHCAEVTKRQGVEVAFTSNDGIGTVPQEVSVCFFRIAQESLRNGIVHGGAKHLRVSLNRSNDELELVVADDGAGFDVAAVQQNGGGLGLVTMEERANLIGGSVSISSQVGRGTTVRMHGPAVLPARGEEASLNHT